MEDEQKKTEEGNEEKKSKKKVKATKKKAKATKKVVKSTNKKSSTKKVAKADETEKTVVEQPVKSVKKDIPVTFTEKKQREKKKGGSGGLILFVFLIIVLLAGAFYRTQQVSVKTDETTNNLREDVSSEVSSLKDKLQNITQELENQKREREEKKRMQYTIASLGLTFTYPSELGTITEEVIEQGEGEELEQSLMLTFSGNPDIWLSAATPGYEDTTGLIYTGDTVSLRTLCTDPLAITESGYCDYINVLNQESLEQVIVLGEDPITNIVKSIPVNVESDIYAGLTLNLRLGLPPVTGRNLFAPTPDESTEESLEDFLRNIVKEDNLSLVTVQNITAFEEIIKTLEKTE